MSKIEWTDATWNPTSGCTRASDGCDRCYAVSRTHRLGSIASTKAKYAGLTVLNPKGDRHFNGTVRTHESELGKPFKWRKPRLVFVNSMSDLFHKDVPFDFIDKAMAAIALTPQHTYQVLTKRPERMAEYFNWHELTGENAKTGNIDRADKWGHAMSEIDGKPPRPRMVFNPLPNLWLGTSIENQQTADERIPHLLQVPAAVRFLSAEPLLGPLELRSATRIAWECGKCRGYFPNPLEEICPSCGGRGYWSGSHKFNPPGGQIGSGIDWVIVGGESGPGARPCYVDWIRSIVDQCKSAGVACFVKQLGAKPYDPSWHGGGTHEGSRMLLNSSKGGDPSEWPNDLRVRQWPEAVA